MNPKFKPLFQAEQELDHDHVTKILEDVKPTHCESTSGGIFKLAGGVNKSSIKLSKHPDNQGKTRLNFKDIKALGIIETPTPSRSDNRAHALLSASSAHRWLNCPPSAVQAELNPKPADSAAAAEGTAAHALAEHKLKKALKKRTAYPSSDFIDDDMQEHTDNYVAFVLEELKKAKQLTPDAQILIEQRLDFSHLVPGGFGTGDVIIIDDSTLHIIDLKYGAGVLVDAENNPQMKLYALGALQEFGYLYDVEEVSMTIYQPRRDNISTWVTTATDLEEWGNHVVAPIAEKAARGEGEYQAGRWCLFCPIKATCRARAEENLKLAQLEFQPPAELSTEELAEVLNKIPALKSWASDVETWATTAATDHGVTFPGFKLVAGRSVRKYSDPDAVAKAAIAAGYQDVYEKKLLGITAMEKYLGKATFNEVLGSFVIKPEGKPTLVPESDRRPAIKGHSAEDDFAA